LHGASKKVERINGQTDRLARSALKYAD
jgi:hypothetical protein